LYEPFTMDYLTQRGNLNADYHVGSSPIVRVTTSVAKLANYCKSRVTICSYSHTEG
jgi:hypothetical protein